MRSGARAVLAAASVALAVLLGACSHHESGVKLTFWTIGREGEVVQQLLPEFEHAHPGVHVEVQQIPLTAAHEKLLTAFAGDALPDVAQIGNTWIPEFAALGALLPLDQQVAASQVLAPGDYFPGIWDTNVIDGKLYGVPWYVDTRLLFYRTDLLAAAGFDHPPRDWDEWRRAMAAIKRNAGPDKYAVFLPLNEFEPLLALGLQQSDPLLRDGGRFGNFESAGFRRALAFYVEMFRSGWAPPMSNTEISNVWDEFARGYFTFYITGPWQIGEFKRRLPPDLQGKWNTAPLPGPDGPGAGAAGGSSIAIFRSSPHAELAWELAQFLSSDAVQRRFYALTGDLPARRSAWDDPTLASEGYARAFRDQLERAKPTPKVPEWERIAQEMQLMADRVIRGGQSQDVALREFDAATDRILAKRRELLASSGHSSLSPAGVVAAQARVRVAFPIAADANDRHSGRDESRPYTSPPLSLAGEIAPQPYPRSPLPLAGEVAPQARVRAAFPIAADANDRQGGRDESRPYLNVAPSHPAGAP